MSSGSGRQDDEAASASQEDRIRAERLDAAAQEPSLPGHDPGFGPGLSGRALFWIAIAFACFQLFTAAYAILPSQVVRAMHVAILVLIAFALESNLKAKSPVIKSFAWGLGAVAIGVGIYQWVFFEDLLLRSGALIEIDVIVGTISLALLFIAAWRIMGLALPIIAGMFLSYCLFGEYLPSPLNHRGYDFEQVIEHMAFGTEGIYGVPTYVSSTFIFLFILFGSFLERAGMIQLFTDLSLGLVGHARGGPAKVSVISSGMMGMISGSGVANVVTTGQFTIPLMKRFGYRPAFAGAVEATSSMGGQIMPPVMGAVAFIMAETLDVPYAEIVKAAIIPALLYFGTVFWVVHLEAGKRGLLGLPKEECPNAWEALKARWYLLLPLAVLVYMLFSGYTPLFAGTVSLSLTALLILGSPISRAMNVMVARGLFWILIGAAAGAFFEYGIGVIAATVALLVLINVFVRGGRETLASCRDALADGARNALPVGIACAIVGIIVGTMTLTGVGTTFGNFVVSIGRESLFLSLVLTMVICLILGMGIPTIPNYIITSSLAGPALLKLGVPLIVSHMFCFYFGIMADLTPPVALAAFAAAPIAKAPPMRIGVNAVRIAVAGFVVPYMAIYTPALMLQDGGPLATQIGYVPAVLYIVFKAGLAISLWGVATIGYLSRDTNLIERVVAVVAAAFLVVATPWSDAVGLTLAALFYAQHLLRARRSLPA